MSRNFRRSSRSKPGVSDQFHGVICGVPKRNSSRKRHRVKSERGHSRLRRFSLIVFRLTEPNLTNPASSKMYATIRPQRRSAAL